MHAIPPVVQRPNTGCALKQHIPRRLAVDSPAKIFVLLVSILRRSAWLLTQ